MKKYIAAMLLSTLALGAMADKKVEKKDSVEGFKFTDVKVNKTTPVKNQAKSGTCWSFSGIGFLEDEILRKSGKETDLSEMWVVRHCYADKADKYVRTDGKINFAQGGGFFDVNYVIDRYGIVPEEAYRGLNYGEELHDHGEVESVLTGMVNAMKNQRKKSTAWKKGVDGVLDAYFGERPATFEYEGKTYTPQSYAKSLGLDMNDYVALTSFTHHPFYTAFPLEVSDNWLWKSSYNVPLDELKAVVDNALDNGYSLAWAADVSEPGFRWKEGYAVIPEKKSDKNLEGTELARWVKLSKAEQNAENNKITGPCKEIEVTQEMRQEMFDNHLTTDDHGMVIMGYATDQNGTKYYKVKNSWDTDHVYGGFFYVSEPYLLAKTLGVMVNKEALPKEVIKKLNL